MPRHGRTLAAAGFTLLPVVLAMSLVAAIAFLLNRDNGVNVNLIGAQSDRERARYAAEAGLQAANFAIQHAVQSIGCPTVVNPISIPPITDNNFGGATYSTNAINITGSPVTLTSIGTYKRGSDKRASVTLTKTNAYVYESGLRTWVTQPGPLTGKDTFVAQGNPINNNGGSQQLSLDKKDGSEILLQFDLSPLPAGSRVVPPPYDLILALIPPGASVSLYQQVASGLKDFVASLITQSWIAGPQDGGTLANGATWNTYDGVNTWRLPGVGYDSRQLVSVPQQLALVSFDVTTSALGWMSGAPGPAPTYVSATSFTLAGDQTTNGFEVGRRIKTVNSVGTIYSTISSSVFGALTTVTVSNDSGTLDSGLSAVSSLIYPNYGVWLHDPTGKAMKYVFNSSNYIGDLCLPGIPPCNRPKLTVNYLLPCGKTAPPSA